MKNIHLLPTDKPSRLGYLTKKGKEVYKDLRLFDKLMPNILDSENQHIYITNNEEIKEGDYRLNIQRDYFKKSDKEGLDYYNKRNDIFKKIILTTDPDLIKDGVQSIDDKFLEWFVKNPSCEEVEVIPLRKSSGHYDDKDVWHWDFLAYKSIIPQEEPKQEWLKNAKWGVRLTKDNQPDFTYVDQWFEGKLFKRDMLKLVYPDSPSFSYSSWKVFDTKELAEEWIKVPKEEPKQEPEYKDNESFMDALRHHLRFEIKKDEDYILNNPQRVRDFQKGYDWIDKPLQELERGITITHVGKQEMTLVNIETYDTKVYTFKNKEGELYHVIKQDSFLNNIYPEYRFMGHNQSEMMDEKTINEIKKVMEKWEK